jgi:hypothetical protein
MYFVNSQFKSRIDNNVIFRIFPKLNSQQFNLLSQLITETIDIIAIKFNFDLKERHLYEQQFEQNDHRDIKAILQLLLPYIGKEDLSNLTDLKELYINKVPGTLTNINLGKPSYEYTNLQYGRCLRTPEGAVEIQFKEEHLKHNFYLLKKTISEMANKLYVNWIDILPININEAGPIPLLMETQKGLAENSITEYDPLVENAQIANYRGISIDEIYNTVSNFLYHDIKNIKWLIYDIKIGNSLLPYIIVWNELLGLKEALDQVSWSLLTVDKQQQFRESFRNIVDKAKKGISNNNIDASALSLLLRVFLIFFSSERNKTRPEITLLKEAITDGYKKLDIDIDPSGEEADEMDITTDNLFLSAESINAETVYEYFRLQLAQFNTTWYATQIVNERGFLDRTQIQNNLSYQFSYKNVYNFSKSLTHITVTVAYKPSYQEFPKLWSSLDELTKKIVIERINWPTNKLVTSWFNIKRYIKNVYGVTGSEGDNKNQQIFKTVKDGLAKIVLQVMQLKGILSQFKPNPKLTDSKQLPQSEDAIEKIITTGIKREVQNKQKYYDNCYNFIDGQKYKDLIIHTQKGKYTYFEHLYNNFVGAWPTTYAMNWISQIGFFHHYLNNQVIYVTGSTGVGKSSQVPKLLVYGLKSIDYNPNGSVIVTQPRIPPTETTARTLSTQMGIPIEEYNSSIMVPKNKDKNGFAETKNEDNIIPTNNYHIRYKNKQTKHYAPVSGLSLTVMTDGLFLTADLKNNLLLRSKTSDGLRYRDGNTYDIVAVDESHEHNGNMDLILTLMKTTLYYNKSVRLVIISATMEEDEPVYRRFYRDINDNLMYPLNSLLSKHNLDRINVDRRFHISPPGQTTRHKIIDNYVPDLDAETVVLNILKESSVGDILVFEPTVRKIQAFAESIEDKLPPGVKVLPYYKDLDKSERTFIEKLTNTSKQTKGFTRAIIVATTLAEASITIGTLKYVVDTGTRTLGIYNYDARQETYGDGDIVISETSRVQRRGRVGRTADGVVYYLYKKGSREGMPTLYDISVSNKSETLYELLKDNGDQTKLIDIDPHTTTVSLENIATSYPDGLDKMIKQQWFYNSVYNTYRGKPTDYDYENNKQPHTKYKTGFNQQTVEDSDGTFYIVHPDELNLIRNITGKILGSVERSYLPNIKGPDYLGGGLIYSKKIHSFWNLMQERLCLYLPVDKSDIYKTELGKHLTSLKLDLDLEDYRQLISYLYSRQYGVHTEMLLLLAMLRTLQSSLLPLAKIKEVDGQTVKEFQELLNVYGQTSGDSMALIKIAQDIIGFINKNIVKIDQPVTISPAVIQNISNQKSEYIKKSKDKNFSNIDPKLLKILINLDHNGKLSREPGLTPKEIENIIKTDGNIDEIIYQISNHKNKIDSFFTHLNSDTIISFVSKYLILKQGLYKYETGITDNKDDTVVTLSWFDQRLSIIEKPQNNSIAVIRSLIHGYGYNVAKRIKGSHLYVNINYPEPESVQQIKLISKKDNTNVRYKNVKDNKAFAVYDTFLKPEYTGEYILYLATDIRGYVFIHTVKPSDVQAAYPYLYTPSQLKKNINIYEKNKKAVSNIVKSLNKGERSILTVELIGNYNHTLDTIRSDFLNAYNSRIWNTLKKMDESERYAKDIENRRKMEDTIKRDGSSYQSGGHEDKNQPSYFLNAYMTYLYRKLNK